MTSSMICVNHKLKVLECHIGQAGEINLYTWPIVITDDARHEFTGQVNVEKKMLTKKKMFNNY